MQSVTEGDLFSSGWVTEAEEKESSSHIHLEGGAEQNNDTNINRNKMEKKERLGYLEGKH